ncbi:MAG: hypothetical protein GY797_08105 [Deltaproteobacteria bacterium]|nr:hypothetical protein [Deltaproteobacteria bacterium]
MKNSSKRLIGSSLSLIIIIPCCACLYFSFISYPPTKTIANRYLDAIIREDFEAAFELGRSKEYCRDTLRESILKDIEKFGGAEVRAVAIEVQGNTGSDDELQFAEIRFAYRDPNQEDWQRAEMRLGTDHEVPGFRYTCGNMLSGR